MLEADGSRIPQLTNLALYGGAKMVQAYCVKDRKMVDMKDPKQITLKNGRPATQGVCPHCGTKVTRIGSGK